MTSSLPAEQEHEHYHRLLQKYDVSGPRYTSYPTAVQFSDAFDINRYQDLVRAETSIAPLSIYVHIPFCRDICYYCGCHKIVTRKQELASEYLDYLEKEIALQSKLYGDRRPVTQLHWGGGTPTFLNPGEITELMHAIASHFHLVDCDSREYSIEVDPRTISKDTLALIKGLGFNRLSMGIQDFDPVVQAAVNRLQGFDHVQTLNTTAKNLGFSSVSFDFIYGLPHQSLDSMRATLQKVLVLSPDRLCFYNYAHMPDRFPTQRSIDRLTLPTADEKLQMLELITETLEQEGYVHIGMDHFVKPTDELAKAQQRGKLQRNFQGYSVNMATTLVGMGPSAISSSNNGFCQNVKALPDYYEHLNRGQLPVQRGVLKSRDDQIRAEVIHQICCKRELDTEELNGRFSIDSGAYFAEAWPQIEEMSREGIVDRNTHGFSVTKRGKPFLRNICMLFDHYYQANGGAQRIYSKAL